MSSDGIDIDDLLQDLNNLGTPTPCKPKAIIHHASAPHHHNQHHASYSGHVSNNQNVPNNTSSSSASSAAANVSPSVFMPHPPSKNKSPTQNNPKIKFAVLPGESSSRSVTPSSSANNHLLQGDNNSSGSGDDLDALLSMIENTNITPAANNQKVISAFSPPKYSHHHQSADPTVLTFSPELMKSSTQFYSQHGLASNLSSSTTNTSNVGIQKSQHHASSSTHTNHSNPSKLPSNIKDQDFLKEFDHDDWDASPPPSSQVAHRPAVSSHHSHHSNAFHSHNSHHGHHHANSAHHLPAASSQQPTVSSNIFSSATSSNSSSSKDSNAAKSRCTKVIVAGTDLPRGCKGSAFSKVACDCLLCSQCNFKVLSFMNSQWDSSVDYMFVRNNMPNVDKLKAKLLTGDAAKGFVAYCCQCQWVSVDQERTLTPGNPSDPQWICTGHIQ